MICILAATITPAAVPEVGDFLDIDGERFRIVGGSDGLGVQTLAVACLYSCHGRS